MLSKHMLHFTTYEIGANFVLWIAAVLYAIYRFYKVSNNQVFHEYEDIYGDFSPGWRLINRKKDTSDVEWETIIYLVIQIFPWLFLHIIISETIKSYYKKTVLKIFQIAISFIFLILYLNTKVILLLMVQPVVFSILSIYKRVSILWICTGISLAGINYFKVINLSELSWFTINEKQHIITIMAIFWTNLRCLSFQVDKIRGRGNENVFDFLCYVFYLPTLFSGPLITFDDYQPCLSKSVNFPKRICNLLKDLTRIIFWLGFTEFSLHFIYVNAMNYQIESVKWFDSWTIYGYGYSMGQFFHLKYIVLYGLSTSFAEFEGVYVPRRPKCIGRIHLYSDMWKHFDEGLYKFLLKYIYIPTLVQKSIPNKVFSSGLCFTFVYVWHGIQRYILFWTVLNFLGITLESLVRQIYKRHISKENYLSKTWERRLSCLIAAPLLALSAISNFYFFAGTDIGNIFLAKFLNDDFKTTLIVIFFLYCCGQVSTEVKIWERNKNLTNKFRLAGDHKKIIK